MRPGRASKTAEHNALFRALETMRPQDARLLDDPLAARFLSPGLHAIAVASRIPPVRDAVAGVIDRRWPGVRTSVVARTRLIDETIAQHARSIGQFVVLGAGYDTRAWRLPCLDGADVIEVDHPDTQRVKRIVVARHAAGGAKVRFVPTDFHLGRLSAAMADAGFDPQSPALFLWEGTTNYLSADAVDATLRWCARSAPGSHLVFTYINRDVLDDPGRYEGAGRVFSSLDRMGEQMTFGIAPRETAEYLAARGLELESDAGAAEYRARYYGPAATAMRGHEFYRVAHALVPDPD